MYIADDDHAAVWPLLELDLGGGLLFLLVTDWDKEIHSRIKRRYTANKNTPNGVGGIGNQNKLKFELVVAIINGAHR